MTKETYLGDGLYASWDGHQIILRAPRDGRDHWVALEPPIYKALIEFVAALRTDAEWTLSERDSAAFVDALLNPPEPNEALKAAADRYKLALLPKEETE